MTPLVLGLGPTELLIILAIVLLLFGGTRLAGLGKSTGRAIREFKEETKDIKGSPEKSDGAATPKAVDGKPQPTAGEALQDDEIHDAEIIDPEHKRGL